MIRLTRLNQAPLVLNSDLIEHIETTPDTVISLTSGQKFRVRETAEQIVELVIQFRQAVMNGLPADLRLEKNRGQNPAFEPLRPQGGNA